MTLKFCFCARGSCGQPGIKGKMGQLLFATSLKCLEYLAMKTVREHQAPSEVLMKSVSVTAIERELAKDSKGGKLGETLQLR